MLSENDLNERVNRELIAHTISDVLSTSYHIKNRFPHIWQYPSRKRLNAIFERYLNDVDGKKILDYGCGRGQSSVKLLSLGADVCGIDISPVYIAEATRSVEQKGFANNRYSFRVMDAHTLEYGNNTFDIVFGEGILHHLDIWIALNEIHRVLKTGGRVIMLEPLADNPLLRLFRLLTPHARTADERPLSKTDLISIVKNDFWNPEFSYCGIIEAPIAMLTSIFISNTQENRPLKIAHRMERWTHDHDLLLSWNQYVLLNLVKKNVA